MYFETFRKQVGYWLSGPRSNLKLLQVMLLLISARIPRLSLSRLAETSQGSVTVVFDKESYASTCTTKNNTLTADRNFSFSPWAVQFARYSLDRFVEKIRQRKWTEVSLTQPVKELQKCCTKPLPSLCFARPTTPALLAASGFATVVSQSRFLFFCFAFFSGISLRKRDCSQS